jgi:hypothetical protein
VNHDTARAQRAERHLGRPRNAEFADDQNVQRRVEGGRDLGRHRHSTADEAEHDNVAPPGVGGQRPGEDLSGVTPVVVRHTPVSTRNGRNPPPGNENSAANRHSQRIRSSGE